MLSESVRGNKAAIVEMALELFALQGFHGTTTAQIARAAGVTEPLIYYHFDDKDRLFTWIIEAIFEFYFFRLDAIESNAETAFERIADLVRLHLQLVEEIPRECNLIVSACPAKLRDPEHICSTNIQKQRDWMTAYLTKNVRTGTETGEFYDMPVEQTVYLIIGYLNGILRQSVLKPFNNGGQTLQDESSVIDAAITFLKRSLVRGAS